METTTAEEPTATRAGGSYASAPPEGSGEQRVLGGSWLRVAALAALALLALVVPVVYGRQAMHVVPTYHMDGAFQTASGLFRLSDGQWPGRDFFPYLGIGPVLVLFPAYLALGSSLAASVFASHLVTVLGLQLVVGLVAALVFRRRPGWAALWGAAVVAVVVAATTVRPALFAYLPDVLATATTPGNSLRPIRALAPYLLAAVAFAVLRGGWGWRRVAWVGVAAGVVAALWSNDYALVSAAGALVLLTLYAVRWRPAPLRPILAALWLTAPVAYLVAGFAATAGGFLALLEYNFIDVREDQFWYFGPWAPTQRIYSLGDVVAVMQQEGALYALAVLVAAAGYVILRPDLGALFVLSTGASTMAGGLAATVGGHTDGYFWSFVLWGYVVAAVVVVRLVVVAVGRIGAVRSLLSRDPVRRTARAVLLAAGVAALVAAGIAMVRANWATGSAVAGDAAYVHDPELGGYLHRDFLYQLGEVDGRDSVLEEYTGLAGAVNGPEESLPVDSVIAALGSQRGVFGQRMAERPEVVVTSAPQVSNWVTWGISANWWFYRDLFRSYSPVQTSPTTLNWTPTEPAVWEAVPCRVRGSNVEIDAPTEGLYEVTLRYSGPGRNARAYTMVQNNINVAAGARGYVGLDPGNDVQRFPVSVFAPGTTGLSTIDVSGGSGRVTRLESCTAADVDAPAEVDTVDLFSRLRLTAVDLTDQIWERGVHRQEAGLFVWNTPAALEELRGASAVRFSDGETRSITDVEEAGDFINVFFDGPRLDPQYAGAGRILTTVP